MEVDAILSADGVIPNLKASSKKQALQELAARAASLTGVTERDILDTLLERERLGSTGVGHGVAIPHGKLVAIGRITGLFARLAQPVDFEAIDDQPVDLVFALLAPEGAGPDHLKALAKVARRLRSPETLAALRATRDPTEIYRLLTHDAPAHV